MKKNENQESLDDVRQIIKSKSYDKKRIIYIDNDVAQILNQVKFEKKIAMGDLCSYLLENFIEEHKEEINNLFKNRLL